MVLHARLQNRRHKVYLKTLMHLQLMGQCAAQVRAVMYVQALTSGIMEAVADTEAAIVAALSHRYSLKETTTQEEFAKRDITASMRERLQLPSRQPFPDNGSHHSGGAH